MLALRGDIAIRSGLSCRLFVWDSEPDAKCNGQPKRVTSLSVCCLWHLLCVVLVQGPNTGNENLAHTPGRRPWTTREPTQGFGALCGKLDLGFTTIDRGIAIQAVGWRNRRTFSWLGCHLGHAVQISEKPAVLA